MCTGNAGRSRCFILPEDLDKQLLGAPSVIIIHKGRCSCHHLSNAVDVAVLLVPQSGLWGPTEDSVVVRKCQASDVIKKGHWRTLCVFSPLTLE